MLSKDKQQKHLQKYKKTLAIHRFLRYTIQAVANGRVTPVGAVKPGARQKDISEVKERGTEHEGRNPS